MKQSPLKTAREKSGKSQPQIAKELQIDTRSYQRYEYGEVIPNVKVGNRIARALGTTSEKLWGYT